MFKLQPQPRSILGIDITSTAVKVLEVSSKNGNPVVESYGRGILPPNVMDGDVIKDIKAVSQCVTKVVDHLHTSCKQAILAVSDAAIISKIIQINEDLNDAEMEELIVAEADKYIPYPIEEINFDFDVLGPSPRNSNLLDVLIVASRTENVNQRVAVASAAGLEAVVIDVESYAVERVAQYIAKSLPELERDKTIAIVDMGASYIHLFVLQGLKLIYSREEKFGDRQLIQFIAERYSMTLDEAEIAKSQGELLPVYKSEILEPFKENILLQIKRTLQFFYSTNQDGDVDYILLAGELARLPGLISLVKERLGVMVTIANPLACITLSQKIHVASINEDGPLLLVACGLALRSIE